MLRSSCFLFFVLVFAVLFQPGVTSSYSWIRGPGFTRFQNTTTTRKQRRTQQLTYRITNSTRSANAVNNARQDDLQILHFIFTETSLLSSRLLEDCQEPLDPTCRSGVAAVSAFARHLIPNNESTLVMPKFQKNSQFVMVHPLGWNINRLVLQGVMKWNAFMSTPSLLMQDKRDNPSSNRDLSYLQTREFPFVISNVHIPPSNTWEQQGFHNHVLFDNQTHIALIIISDNGKLYNYDQVETTIGLLSFIQNENSRVQGAEHPCISPKDIDLEKETLFSSYQAIYDMDMNGRGDFLIHSQTALGSQGSNVTNETSNYTNKEQRKCWIPVILYYDNVPSVFETFMYAMLQAPNRPAVILDVGNNTEAYQEPTFVQAPLNSTVAEATVDNQQGIWVHSFFSSPDLFLDHQFTINTSDVPPSVLNLRFLVQDMREMPDAYKDNIYESHIRVLRQLADEAISHNPIVGTSMAFPPQRLENVILCNAGECEAGNLFTNAIQWYADTDIAFVTSGGLRGSGWPPGPVRLSNVWEILPFPNTLCTGKMSGISLFILLDYSFRTATFTTEHTNDADQLLQVAGLKIIYNENIRHGLSRLVAVDVWDRKLNKWNELDPSRLYSFASSSYECLDYDPYPQLTGANGSFTITGEQGGVVGEDIVQDMVKEYLSHFTEPYNTSLQGRIAGTTAGGIMNFLLGEENCSSTEYFSPNQRVCKACPNVTHLTFSDKLVKFQHQLGRTTELQGALVNLRENRSEIVANATGTNDSTAENLFARVLLTNRETSNFTVTPKLIPSWLTIVQVPGGLVSKGQDYLLLSGTSLVLLLTADPTIPQVVGTVVGSVSFGVVGDKNIKTDPGSARCDEFNQDLTFDASLTILPQQDLNHLGDIRFVGLSFMAVAQLSAFGFALFVRLNRKTRIVKTMQPHFLKAICLGIFILSSTILPLSFDDGIISPEQCSKMCAAIPWFFSTGSTIVFTILFAKLWRINRLFGAQRFQRVTVTERDVLGPFFLLFSANVALLIAWTIVDPMQWTRHTVPGEPWKTYGACTSNSVGYIFMGLIGFLLLIALVIACHQAYKARNISDEFSESKNLGLSLFAWLQVLVVGAPTVFLVDPEDFTARYFIMVGLLFVLSESMLMMIFVPLVKGVIELKKDNPNPSNGYGNSNPSAAPGGKKAGGTVVVSGIPSGMSNDRMAHRPAIGPVEVLNLSPNMYKDMDMADASALSCASMRDGRTRDEAGGPGNPDP